MRAPKSSASATKDVQVISIVSRQGLTNLGVELGIRLKQDRCALNVIVNKAPATCPKPVLPKKGAQNLLCSDKLQQPIAKLLARRVFGCFAVILFTEIILCCVQRFVFLL